MKECSGKVKTEIWCFNKFEPVEIPEAGQEIQIEKVRGNIATVKLESGVIITLPLKLIDTKK